MRKVTLMGTAAVAAFVLAGPVLAQTGPAQSPVGDQPNAGPQEPRPGAESAIDESEVVVTGIRRSLQSSQDIKKNASQIVDAISAEDVGKFPDKNVGEALQRVTGVQLERDSGEGRSINIRGIQASLNRYEVNGVTVLDTGNTRGVDFRDFPVEFISRVEVVKSVSADVTEGGLGGTVRIITRRPFDKKGFTAAGSVQGIKSNVNGDLGVKAAGLVSTTFADDRVGVLLGVTYEERKIRTDGVDTLSFTLGPDRNGDGRRDILPAIYFFNPNTQANKRLGINYAVQFQATDDLMLYAEGFRSSRKFDSSGPRLSFQPQFGTVSNVVVGDDNIVDAFRITGGRVFNNNLSNVVDNLVQSNSVGADYKGDRLKAAVRLTKSSSHAETDAFALQARDLTINYDVDYNNPKRLPNIVPLNHNPSVPTDYRVALFRNNPSESTQSEYASKFDMSYDVGPSFLRSIDGGFIATKRKITNQESDITVTFNNTSPLNGESNPSIFARLASGTSPSNFFHTGDLNGINMFAPWFTLDRNVLSAYPPVVPVPVLVNTYDVTERVSAGYLKANFGGDLGPIPFSGNIGFRYSHTEVGTNGYQVAATGASVPLNIRSDYNAFLPSGNLKFDLVPRELFLRFGAGRVLARPAPAQLAPSLRYDNASFEASRGNPGLRPIRAAQYDASLEWYPSRSTAISGAVFRKDVTDALITVTTQSTIPGVGPRIPGDPTPVFFIAQPQNNPATVKITGFEVGINQDLSFLPGFLGGFGFQANYTYAKSGNTGLTNSITGQVLPYTGLSKNSYNLTAFYEKYGFSGRLSYNWRDDYLRVEIGQGGFPNFRNAYGQLDGSFSYEVIKDVSLFVDVVNITNQTLRGYAGFKQLVGEYDQSGRFVYFGARARF